MVYSRTADADASRDAISRTADSRTDPINMR